MITGHLQILYGAIPENRHAQTPAVAMVTDRPLRWISVTLGQVVKTEGAAPSRANKFFEVTVRIQEDRDHTVIATGP